MEKGLILGETVAAGRHAVGWRGFSEKSISADTEGAKRLIEAAESEAMRDPWGRSTPAVLSPLVCSLATLQAGC